MTQLYCNNGGGVVFDPVYGDIDERCQGYQTTAYNQIEDFLQLALKDETIKPDAELQIYSMYDVPCKVITELNWNPVQFVESSIRAKTALKDFTPRDKEDQPMPITFKVGLLYFLGEPIHSPGQTWYAARCDMQRYNEQYLAKYGHQMALSAV